MQNELIAINAVTMLAHSFSKEDLDNLANLAPYLKDKFSALEEEENKPSYFIFHIWNNTDPRNQLIILHYALHKYASTLKHSYERTDHLIYEGKLFDEVNDSIVDAISQYKV